MTITAVSLYTFPAMKDIFRLNTKQIAGMAILTALAVALALAFHIPIFPAVAFLEYDMADIPIFLGTFMYGPFAGIIMTVIVSVIQGVTVSAGGGPIGILMHVLATGSYVLVSGFIYRKHKTFKGALASIGAGILTWMVFMILWNILFTPIYMGVPRKMVIDLLGFIAAFNAVKVTANSLATVLLYKRLRYLFSYIFKTDKFERKNNRKKFKISDGCEIVVHTQKETELLAESFAELLHGGEVVLLNGILGAGKTTFTKGIAKALGVNDIVTSPTFTIMKEYAGRIKIRHFDMYRIERADELEETGLRELLYEEDTLCIIEWNKFDDLRETITVDIEYVGENERKFSFKGIRI